MRYAQTGKTEYAEDGSILRSGFDAVQEGVEAHNHFVHGDITAFRSSVDGSIISDRKQLAEHNRKHGVTQDSFKDRIAARTAERENLFGGRYKDSTRRADIRDAVERCRGEGDNRHKYD